MDPLQAKLVAAGAGSLLTAITMTPFDVVKTRLQTQPPKAKHHQLSEVVCVWDHGVWRQERVNGFYDALKHVAKAEGFKGLWKGAGTAILIGVPSSTLYMVTYDHLLHSVFPLFVTPSAFTPLIAGITARTFISTMASPLELIRTNLQSTPLSSSNPNTFRSVISRITGLVRKQGPTSLWKGLSTTLWRDVPFSGLYWANYEGLKSWFNRNGHEGTPVAFASGAMSGIIAALITSPFDVLKTRRQASIMSTPSHTIATLPMLRHMVRTEGYSALYTGIGPRMAKIAPACGIMIACYEGVGKLLEKPL